jgi:hypothetical protein
VSPDDAKIIWLRAEGYRWRYVCIQAGCVRQTAWRRWVAALATIAKKVNGAPQPKSSKIGLPSPPPPELDRTIAVSKSKPAYKPSK